MTTINHYAFQDCTGLTTVIIGSGVTSFGTGVFSGCYSLTSVISLIENPFEMVGKDDSNSPFEMDNYNNATLYVPMGTIDKYKETEGWKDFVNIKENTLDGIASPMLIQAEDSPTYDLQGRRVAEGKPLHPGIYVKDGRKFVVK